MKDWCNLPGCTVTPRANDLKKHYMSLTNEEMLDRLNQAVSDKKFERLLSKADENTQYIYSGKYSVKEKFYPNYPNHVTVQNLVSSDKEPETPRT